MFRRVTVVPAMVAVLALGLAGCSTTSPSASGGGQSGGGSATVVVAASIDAWGSILSQLGGTHVRATSIISDPATDPHAYEPTPADGRTIADSKVFVENGVGYDAWAARAVAASPDPARTVVDVGQVTGTPDNGNPHRWYSPADVAKVADAITAGLKTADPTDAAYFDGQRAAFDSTGLGRYHQLIDDIRTRYSGVKVGASESIVSPLAEALGLDLVTPASLLRAISEGNDPSAADKATVDAQIAGKQIAVYVYNSQNSTPDVAAQVDAVKAQGIPVVQVTETLSPAGASFQDWQAAQLTGLQAALAQATGQ